MRYTVDRIEGCFAVCEDENGKMEKIELSVIPSNVKEGDVLISDGGDWKKDDDAKRETAERIKKKMDALWG